jgi:hypothetical protein
MEDFFLMWPIIIHLYTKFHQKHCERYITMTLYSLCKKCGSRASPIHMIGLENNLTPLKLRVYTIVEITNTSWFGFWNNMHAYLNCKLFLVMKGNTILSQARINYESWQAFVHPSQPSFNIFDQLYISTSLLHKIW